jgi:arsenite-transporting ATPase
MQEVRFKAALEALSDPQKTTVMLVMRPDAGAIAEAARTSDELHALGLHNQRMVVNGVFHASDSGDSIACAMEKLGTQAIAEIPGNLMQLPQDQVPLRAFDTVGVAALRALLGTAQPPDGAGKPLLERTLQHGAGLNALADELAKAGHGQGRCG